MRQWVGIEVVGDVHGVGMLLQQGGIQGVEHLRELGVVAENTGLEVEDILYVPWF
jgi:hypothetical protein